MMTAITLLLGLLAAMLVLAAVKLFFRTFLERYGVRQSERTVREEAAWIGQTGLDESTERELPRYLRRELGEFLSDAGALRAADLHYVGVFTDARGPAHFWQMPERGGEQAFAYVDVDAEGKPVGLGWGDRAPQT